MLYTFTKGLIGIQRTKRFRHRIVRFSIILLCLFFNGTMVFFDTRVKYIFSHKSLYTILEQYYIVE